MDKPMTSSWTMRRRDLLCTAGVFLGASLAGGAFAAIGAPNAGISQGDFLTLSQILTGRKALDPVISARALSALAQEDAAFSARAGQLHHAITQARFTDMRNYRAFIAGHADLAPVAVTIISAWYLGYTGTPEGEASTDNARFVTYAGALMYQPTMDATVIPTFSRGHTNYWVNPPATLATD